MSSPATVVSALPAPVTARVYVRDTEKDVLFLITQYLRDVGLSTTVVALLRESGLDPFWLCGPSREVALLREWVLQGEWLRVKTLLAPLRVVLSDESYAVAVALVEKQALMEEFFMKITSIDRRRGILDELQSHRTHSATRLTRQEMQRCLRVLKDDQQSDWSLDEARLSCFESLVPLFRDEITDEDDESKYLRMPRRQLVALLHDALLLHQQNQRRGFDIGELVALTPQSTEALEPSGSDGEAVESLSSLQLTESAPRQWRVEARDALSQSVSALPSRGLKAAVHKSTEGRKRNPLVMSMDISQHRSRRISLEEKERIAEDDEKETEEIEEEEDVDGVDASTQTYPIDEKKPQDVEKTTVRESHELRKSLRDVSSNQSEPSHDDAHLVKSSVSHSSLAPPEQLMEALPVQQTQSEFQSSSSKLSRSHDSSSSSPTRREGEESQLGKQSKTAGPEDDPMSPHEEEEEGDFDEGGSYTQADGDQPPALCSYSQLTIDSVVRAHVVAQVREPQAVRALDISPDGSEMVIGTNARALRVFDLSEPLATAAAASSHSNFLPLLPVSMEKHKHHSSSIYVAAYNHVDPDYASPLIATGAAESSIKVLSRWTQQELWIRSHAGKCRALQFASPHLLCSAASGDLLIRAWNLEASDGSQPTCVQRFDGHVGEIQALAISQYGQLDSRSLVSSAMDKTVRLWDLRSAQCARVLTRTASPSFTLAFQPHAYATNVLATGHQDGSVALWDIRASSKKLASISHHQDECRAVSWSPDGRWLLSASFDGTLCLMEASPAGHDLTAVASFHQHDDKVLQAQWHPTQPAILTTGADKLIKLWGFA